VRRWRSRSQTRVRTRSPHNRRERGHAHGRRHSFAKRDTKRRLQADGIALGASSVRCSRRPPRRRPLWVHWISAIASLRLLLAHEHTIQVPMHCALRTRHPPNNLVENMAAMRTFNRSSGSASRAVICGVATTLRAQLTRVVRSTCLHGAKINLSSH
jgi:hypothetical protein